MKKTQPHTTDVVVLETQVERPTYKREKDRSHKNLESTVLSPEPSGILYDGYCLFSWLWRHAIPLYSCILHLFTHYQLLPFCIGLSVYHLEVFPLTLHFPPCLDLEHAHPDVDTCTKLEGSHPANRKPIENKWQLLCPDVQIDCTSVAFLASSSTPKTIHSHKKLRFFLDFSPGSGWGTDSIPQWQTLNGRSHPPWWRNRTNASRFCTKWFPAHEDLVHPFCLSRDNTAVQ